KRFDEMNSKIENSIFDLESKMNNRFDRLEKKVDGIRVELTETQETTDYLLSKNAQHERKLRELSRQR
ncbi:Synaptonemal complex 1, partial [Oceanobacillus caeni]